LLEDAGFEVLVNPLGRRLRREEMGDVLREAGAVLAGVEPYDAGLLEALPKLRCISRCGVGLETIDREAARRLAIAVYTTPDEVIEPVAEMAVAMMLALARNIPFHVDNSRQGRWAKRTGFLVAEWTIGLIGFGRIGRAVERLLKGFAPRILVTDPNVAADELPAGVAWRTLPSLLAESDLVSLHASRSPSEGPLLGRGELSMMKRGSYLVNTARGLLVDETALSDALRAGYLAGAALDVFETEPYAGALLQLPNVLCTPHVSTLTRASRARMEWRCASHVVRHFGNGQ